MKSYIKLAWRNIWRNKRRAAITIASVFFAVFFALLMRSLQLGSYANMERNIVEFYNGYIQVMDSNYWDNKTINNTMVLSDSIASRINTDKNVKGLVPRLESFALASAGDLTKGIMVVGADPEREDQLTGIADRVIKGSYFTKGADGIMLGEKLASYLKLDINDTIVLIGQGFHGISAAGKYPVSGILHFPSPELNSRVLYMPLETAQYFYSADNRVTSVVIDIADRKQLSNTIQVIRAELGDAYDVMSWREMLTELVQQIESDNASGIIMLGILYMVIAFGVLGTVIMMTAERRKEMGVMVAVGMQRKKLAIITGMETFMLGLIGVLAGCIAALPILSYFKANPIPATGEMKAMFEEFGVEALWVFSNDFSIYLNQGLAVIVITGIALLYPVIRILNLNPIKAIRD